MALPRFRRYDVQARYSLIISVASIVPLAAATYATCQRYDPQLRAIQYANSGVFRPAFLACIAGACLLAVIGAALGFNSAGQRRNTEQRKSWTGFFIGTAALSLSIILFAAYAFLKLPIDVGSTTGMILLG